MEMEQGAVYNLLVPFFILKINLERHNHNDIGQFIVYADGKPVIIDVGVETYTAKTFSERRYEIWTMELVQGV